MAPSSVIATLESSLFFYLPEQIDSDDRSHCIQSGACYISDISAPHSDERKHDSPDQCYDQYRNNIFAVHSITPLPSLYLYTAYSSP